MQLKKNGKVSASDFWAQQSLQKRGKLQQHHINDWNQRGLSITFNGKPFNKVWKQRPKEWDPKKTSKTLSNKKCHQTRGRQNFKERPKNIKYKSRANYLQNMYKESQPSLHEQPWARKAMRAFYKKTSEFQTEQCVECLGRWYVPASYAAVEGVSCH